MNRFLRKQLEELEKELKEDIGKKKHKLDVKGAKDSPKEVIGYDSGVTDRGLTGFPSDIHVLTQKEKMGKEKKKKKK